jgi:hypothetical protein
MGFGGENSFRKPFKTEISWAIFHFTGFYCHRSPKTPAVCDVARRCRRKISTGPVGGICEPGTWVMWRKEVKLICRFALVPRGIH